MEYGDWRGENSNPLEELTALDRRTHPSDMPTWKFQPCIYSEKDLEAQVRQGLRPDPATVLGGFWAPKDDVRHWSRQTQTWSLPALFHVYGNSWTMRELYGIWMEMPLVVKSPKRGTGPKMKEHLGNLKQIQDDVACGQFAMKGSASPWMRSRTILRCTPRFPQWSPSGT